MAYWDREPPHSEPVAAEVLLFKRIVQILFSVI
jgi:hypothetical protein